MSLAEVLAFVHILAFGPGGLSQRQEEPTPAVVCAVTGQPPAHSTPARSPARLPDLRDKEVRRRIVDMSKLAAGASARGQWDTVSLALSRKAQLFDFLGQPDSAMPVAREALESASRGSEAELEARLALGETLQYRGYSGAALPHYQRSLALVQTPDRARQRGRVCNDLGIAYHELGDVDRALIYLSRARAIRAAVGDSNGVATTLNNIGRAYSTTGRPSTALVFFDSALTLRRRLRDPVGEAAALNNKGYTYDLMGLPAPALEMYRQALTALTPVGSRYLQGLTFLNIGRAYLALGRPREGQEYLLRGKKAKEQAGDAAGVGWAYHDLGRASLALGRWEEGVAWLDKARADLRERGDPVREGSALYYLASAYQAAGDSASLRHAVAAYDTAAAVRLAVRGRIRGDADRVLFAEQDRNLTDQWALAWLALGRWIPGDVAAKASLVAVERGRARALLDLLGATASGGERLPGMAAANVAAGADPAREADALLRPLRTAQAPGLSYLVTPRALLTWFVLPSGEVKMYCQRASAAWLDTLVTGLRGFIYAPKADRGGVVDSGATMLTQSESRLPADCLGAPAAAGIVRGGLDSVLSTLAHLLLPRAVLSRLPDSGELANGDLALVPFAALPVDAAGTPLGVRFGLRYSPSLAFLASIDASARPFPQSSAPSRSYPTAVVVGDPAMPVDPETGTPFPALHLAGETARWLAAKVGTRALTASAAMKAKVVAALPAAWLVHLGTHGRAFGAEAQARQSFVVLAADATDNGLLTVGEVVDSLRLRADLIVLLACETGLGDIKQTEGTVGLQRAFLARGARSVLVSLWKVDTAATDVLIREFYDQWLDPSHPVTKAEALRRAQEKLWTEWMTGRGSPDERLNPYWWAGFQLVGAH